jgi:DNA-binding response OmpR family regulator
MPNLSNTVTFLFAGDGSLASDGLSAFLQTKSNFLLMSECRDGASAIADIQAHRPEIAVIDAHLPDMSARQIIEAVRATNLESKIIVLGASADRNIADELLSAGGDAYIVRNGPSRHLNDAIRYVRDGGKYLSPQLTQDAPVSSCGLPPEAHLEAMSCLHEAVEAQARTVERLEIAMDRAQYAIELLQQKVEQLTGAPIEAPSSSSTDETEPSRKSPRVKTGMGAVAAALVVGILGFQLAGILQPATATESPLAEFSSGGAEDALKPGTGSLHLAGWEAETIDHAESLMKNQQYAAAEKVCRKVLRENPSNTAATLVLASALFHQNRVGESADVLQSMAVPSTRVSLKQSPFDN